ncbi:MAG: tetratricopeptide repeat protein [Deltaproteobacteria bacterium]|nr:tetratricopeptide repeat protein [Deltaproteobacteria bacterium]
MIAPQHKGTSEDVPPELGWALVAVAGLSLLLAGAVRPWQLALVHLLVAGVAFYATRLPDRVLERGRDAVRLGAIGSLLAAVMALGLVVVPRQVASVLAPGLVTARPEADWLPLTLAPERTVDELALLLLAVAFAVLVGLWRAAHPSAEEAIERGLVLFAGVVVVLAFVHAWTGASSVLGLIPVQTPPHPFFAPLVNPNHLGVLLVLVLPTVIGAAWDRRSGSFRRWERLPVTTVALGTVALTLALTSVGAWLAAIVALGTWLLASARGVGLRLGGVFAAFLIPLFVGLVGAVVPAHWYRSSVTTRLEIWGDLTGMAAEHWGSGVGGGTFALAFPAYRTAADYESVHHAHSDLFEWGVETGMVGGLVAVLAAVGMWRMARHHPRGPVLRRLGFGLLGVALLASYEFALQIPAVLLCVAGAVALLVTGPSARVVPARRMRQFVWILALGQLALVGWQVRREVADSAARTIATTHAPGPVPDRAARRLGLTAPWRAEGPTYRAYEALSQGDREGAAAIATAVVRRHPHDGTALRRSAVVLARAGHPEAGESGLRRALERDPNDYRTWAELSRLLRRQGHQGESVEAWGQALRRWPYQYSRNAVPLREAYRMDPSGLWWLHVLKEAPAYQSLYLARVLQEEGEPEVAKLALEQAVFLQPGYAFSVHRAITLRRLGQPERAEAALRAIVARDPEVSSAHVELAKVLLEQDRPEEAIAVYRAAVERFPALATARIGLIRATERQSGPDAALPLAEGLLLTGEHMPAVALELARLQGATGHPERCVRTVDQGDLLEVGAIRERAARLRSECLEQCTVCGGE